MNLELDIENLVLHGFSASNQDRIARALHRELERLFAEEGMPPSLEGGGDLVYPDDEPIVVTQNSTPEMIGIQMARALYGGFK